MSSFTLGTFRATDKMKALVSQVLDSGRLSYGPLSRKFETDFAFFHDSGYGVLSNSGTSSLQVALQALKELHGWKDGDEVIVPALTFVATINVIYHCRLTPVLVDVDLDYYALDPRLIEDAITPRTRCIMPVHPFGQPADMETVCAVAQEYNLHIIEDSCEAMFVRSGELKKPVGSWGDVGCFSTYIAHLITGGIGGVGITNNPDLARKMRSLVNHGIALENLPTGQLYDPSFLARNFEFDSIGHSFRITEMEAALLLPQLDTWQDMIDKRGRNAATIYADFDRYGYEVQLPKIRKGSEHSWMVFPLVMTHETKHGIMAHLRKNKVECRDMLPLTTQPCYDFDPALYPVADWINNCGFYIGCHQDLNHMDFEYLGDIFHLWFKSKREKNAYIRTATA